MTQEETVREWFKDHNAVITNLSEDTTIIDWRKPGTGMYAVRYILDGYHLFISGDLGSATYRLTWKATPESFRNIHLDYFNEKKECNSRFCFKYDENQFDKDVTDYLENYSDGREIERKRLLEELFESIKDAMYVYNNPEYQSLTMFQAAEDHENARRLNLDVEDLDYISKFGRITSLSHVAYLEGLKMIAEQIEQ